MKSRIRIILLLCGVAMLAPLYSQQVTGSLLGTVQDQQNAAESWCLNDPARGMTMGIDVNEKLAAQNWHRFVKETIPHEVAHLLLCQMGIADWHKHTPMWSTVVRDQGADPKPFHDYRTEQ